MSAIELLVDGFPHGTVEGYQRGCRTNHCPAAEHGLSCTAVRTRYISDWGFKKAIDAGATVDELLEQERAAAAAEVERERAERLAAREAARAPKVTRLSDAEKARRKAERDAATAERRAAREAEKAAVREAKARAAQIAREAREEERAQLRTAQGAAHAAARERRAAREGESAAVAAARLAAGPSLTHRRSRSTRVRVAELYAEGLLDAEIAERLEISASYVTGIRKELDLPRHRRAVKRANREPKPESERVHGTVGGYSRGCRGDDCPSKQAGGISCGEASRAYHRAYMARRRAQAVPAEQHGTPYGYQLGCKDRDLCPGAADGVTCTDASNAAETERRRAKGIEPPKRAEHGTRGGYRFLGCRDPKECPSAIAGGKSCREVAIAHQKAALARKREREGWVPDRRRLPAATVEAIRERSTARQNDTAIAAELGLHQATVSKVRRRLGLPAVAGAYGKRLSA